jgi:hypothetical protein
LHQDIPVLPQGGYSDTAAAQYNNNHNSDNNGVVVFLGLDGHLIVHDFFSCLIISIKIG